MIYFLLEVFMGKMVEYFIFLGKMIWLPLLLLAGVWCTGVVYYNLGLSGIWRYAATLAFFLVITGMMFLSLYGKFILALDVAVIEIFIIGYFLSLTPQKVFSGKQWQPPWRRNAVAVFADQHRFTLYNIRNFAYNTPDDYEMNYLNMQFDLREVRFMDLAVSHWDNLQSVAHTMLSFEFADGRHLAFSVETRLPEGATQGFIPGMYKQYGLLVIAGTENDLFKLRTNYRKEELFLYRTTAAPLESRFILHTLLQAINRHIEHPQFYNSITKNCTTSLAPMLRLINPGFTGDIRLLLNGYSDELLFELGYLKCRQGETFEELKRRSRTNQYIYHPGIYSQIIRSGMD